MRSIKLPSWIERVFGLDPIPVPPHVFRLGPRRLDYCRLNRVDRRWSVGETKTLELAPGTFQDGLLGGLPKEAAAFRSMIRGFVKGLPGQVKEASLVLPDAWMRVAFSEIGDLPASGKGRDEALRWKLKRLVPFRVEDLRVQAVEVRPLLEQDEPRRLMIAFAAEGLLAQVERAFSAAGVRLGQVTSASLATFGSVDPPPGKAQLHGIVTVDQDGYSLVFAQGGDPVVHRYKAEMAGMDPEARAGRVLRDLRLTQTFLEQQFPGSPVVRVMLASSPSQEPAWRTWIADSFGLEPETFGIGQLSVLGRPDLDETHLVPMVGAGTREIA